MALIPSRNLSTPVYFLVNITEISHISYDEKNSSRIAPDMYPYQSFSATGFRFVHCASVVLYAIDYAASVSTSIIQTASFGCGHREAAEIAFRLVDMGCLPHNWARAAILRVQGACGSLRQYRGSGFIGQNNGRIHLNNIHPNASSGIKIDLRKVYRALLEFFLAKIRLPKGAPVSLGWVVYVKE